MRIFTTLVDSQEIESGYIKLGKNKMMEGNMISKIMTIKSQRRNGTAPRIISAMVVPRGATPIAAHPC